MTDTYGFKISKEGKDVKTATGDDLIMEAEDTMIKVFSSGTVEVKFSDGIIEITHNLGYVPCFLVYYQEYDGVMRLATGYFSGFDFSGAFASADEEKISFIVGSLTDIPVYYYIFHDQA
jgi:hypothetical protein